MLTSLTVILAIPTLIASLWGMNVPVPFQNSNFGFIIMLVMVVIVTVVTIIWLKMRDLLS